MDTLIRTLAFYCCCGTFPFGDLLDLIVSFFFILCAFDSFGVMRCGGLIGRLSEEASYRFRVFE